MKDLYKILDVPPDASMQEIKERYHYLAFAYHPDRFGKSEYKNKAEADFRKINDAYLILSDPIRRCEYDRRREATISSTHTSKPRYRSYDGFQGQVRYKYSPHKTYQTQCSDPKENKSKKYKTDMPADDSGNHTGTQKSKTGKTFFIGLLLIVILVVYSTRNMSAFINYGVFDTVAYSLNKSLGTIHNGLNDLFGKWNIEQRNEDTTLHEIVDETPPQIPSIYTSSTVRQGVNSYDLPAFDQNLALLNEYRFWPTGYSANNFIIQGDIAWHSSTRSANWDQSGCGFVFGFKDEENYHTAYLALDGYVRLQRVENGESINLQGGYYGRVDTPQGKARFALEKLAAEIAVYINDQPVVRLKDQTIDSGGLAYAVFSGTNAHDGIRCEMENVTLWTTP